MAELKYKKGDNGKYGFVDENDNWVIQPQFDGVGSFQEGFAKVELDGKWGFIKTDGSWLVEPKFDDAEDFYKGEAEVFENGFYKILLADGSFKKMSKMESYILNCKNFNHECYGWSFLEASNKDDKWNFDSWCRVLSDNHEWYELRYDDDVEEVERYYDEVEMNKDFAVWANSLNLSTSEEVGELLWANAQFLINEVKRDDFDDGGYYAPLYKLSVYIQLYNQLVNLKSLGLMDLRKSLDLPEEDEIYLNPEKIKKEGVKFCAKEVAKEDGFEYLDFSELLERSREPGDYNYISDYDFNFVDRDEDDDEDWEEDED